MKKISFIIPLVLFLAAGCNSSSPQAVNTPSTPPSQTIKVPSQQMTTSTTSTPQKQAQPQEQQSMGTLSSSSNGQLYTNQSWGIEFVVPSNWELGKTTHRDVVTFVDKTAGTKYYQQNQQAFQNLSLDQFIGLPVLTVQRFPTLDAYKQYQSCPDSTSLKQCWAASDNTPEELKVFATINGQPMYNTGGCGDICEEQYLIQYKNTVYRFDTSSYFYTNSGSIEKTLKFLK